MNNRFPNLGIWHRDWAPPGNLTLETSGIWLQNFHRTGKTDSWKTQTKPCVHQDPGERSNDPTRNWARLLCECPRVSSGGMGRWCPVAGLGVALCAQDLLKEVAIIFINSNHILASGQATGREHSLTHQQKIGLKIYWEWPCPSKQDPFPPSVSLSHQEASISLLSLSIREQTEWKLQSQKTNQTDHMDYSQV